jgi:hypothetical protein
VSDLPAITDERAAFFWSRLDMSSGATGCWLWSGARRGGGYGQIHIARIGGRNIRVFAHRAAWFLAHNEWPARCVCHSCDTPLCCNPAHLFLGTHGDNMRDKQLKGRTSRGETSGVNRLSSASVQELRARYMSDITATAKTLALEFGVGVSTVRSALLGRTWAHVPLAVTKLRGDFREVIP